MNINTTLRQLHKYADDNAPVILTGMAVAGATITAIFAAQGAYKAANVINEAEALSTEPASTQEKFLLTYKFYAPAAATLVGTSGCMIMATKIGLNRTAAAAAALAVTERTYDQYKDKVKETLGEKKHVAVTDQLAQDQVAAMPSSAFTLTNEGEQIFLDAWSGRTISTTREKIERAVNDFNKEMIYGGYASLSDFYNRIGLDDISESDEIGWNKSELLEMVYTAVLKDDKAVCVFTFDRKPMSTFRDGSI